MEYTIVAIRDHHALDCSVISLSLPPEDFSQNLNFKMIQTIVLYSASTVQQFESTALYVFFLEISLPTSFCAIIFRFE